MTRREREVLKDRVLQSREPYVTIERDTLLRLLEDRDD